MIEYDFSELELRQALLVSEVEFDPSCVALDLREVKSVPSERVKPKLKHSNLIPGFVCRIVQTHFDFSWVSLRSVAGRFKSDSLELDLVIKVHLYP